METILIRPELLEQVKNQTKITTCRYGIRTYPLGKTILKSNASEDFVYINITDLKYCKFKDITDGIAKSDGFESKENLIAVMRDIYGDITEGSDITIVCFELCDTSEDKL
jgi:hypothetical protein